MFQLLGCLFFLLLGGILIVLSLGFSILDAILRMLGLGRRRPTVDQSEQNTTPNSEPQKMKFSPDEGEYIDFEEV